MTSWAVLRVEPADLERIDHVLRAWESAGGCGGNLQAGDVGWKLRFGRQKTAESLLEWQSPEGETGAVMCQDSPADWWFAMNPAFVHDWALATAIAEWAEGLESERALSIDGPGAPAVWRQVFAERGFDATTEAWLHFWKPLTGADIDDVPGVETTAGDDRKIADRVAVQRAAFANSTFTVERWHAMAAGPSFRPEFDLLARDATGGAAAAVTAWLPGEGKSGMLEPMGTHPDYQRIGHGKRVILAACAALAQAGASGVCVVTPASNVAAVAAYRSAGFRRLGLLSAMVRPCPEGRLTD